MCIASLAGIGTLDAKKKEAVENQKTVAFGHVRTLKRVVGIRLLAGERTPLGLGQGNGHGQDL